MSLFFHASWDAFGKQFLTLFTVIPLILLILGLAWEAVFDAIYGDPANFCFSWEAHGTQFLSLFTVIPLIFLILGHAWEAAFVAIYGDPAHFVDLSGRLGSSFCRYLR